MKKIVLITCILFLITFAVFANGQKEKAEEVKIYKIDLATSYANNHIFAKMMDEMAKELNATSNGRLEVKTFHDSIMGSEKDNVDSISNGSLQLSIVGGGQIGSLYPEISVFDAPFCISDNDQLQKVNDSQIGKDMFEGLAAKRSIRILGSLYAGRRFITTSTKPVYSPEDLKGLKIRVPDQELSIANFRAFGANPTPMAFSEVYLALQQRVVDGQENPLTQIMSAKFYEVQKYISLTGHVTQVVFLVANEQFLNSLPNDLKQLIIEVGAKYSKMASDDSVAYEEEQLAKLDEYGMIICEPDVGAFKELSKAIVSKYSDNWGSGLYEKIQSIN